MVNRKKWNEWNEKHPTTHTLYPVLHMICVSWIRCVKLDSSVGGSEEAVQW